MASLNFIFDSNFKEASKQFKKNKNKKSYILVLGQRLIRKIYFSEDAVIRHPLTYSFLLVFCLSFTHLLSYKSRCLCPEVLAVH